MPYSLIYLSALILISGPDHDPISRPLPYVTCNTHHCIIREEWTPGCMMALAGKYGDATHARTVFPT